MSKPISVENYSSIVTEAIRKVSENPEVRVDEIAEQTVENAVKEMGLNLSEDEKAILTFQVVYSVVGS